MTAVLFKFAHPDGTPVADAPFNVTLRKTSFDEKLDVGIILPGDVQGLTDANGEATLELLPGFGIYFLTMAANGGAINSDGCTTGLRYRFQVPDSATPVRVEDIIVTEPTFSRPWDEVALQVIIDAKAATLAAAAAADTSATNAHNSELAAGVSAGSAADSATLAGQHKDAAGQSATDAGLSASASEAARLAAEGFRDQARTSELAATGSATAAQNSANEAEAKKLAAAEYAERAEFAAGDAEIARQGSVAASEASAASAVTAGQHATQTGLDKAATAADVVASTGLKDETTDLRDEAKVARDEAVAAAGAAVGAFVDGGIIDLSGGAYPPKPTVSTIWKVSVGGTVAGTVYRAGDNLVYTKADDLFYKNDNNSAVVSVNGRNGTVVLDKTDVGLDRANNTNDLEKPISTAAQAAFDARTPTQSRTDTTAGRLIKVGDYGENGGGAIVLNSSQDANAITVPGTYIFNGGGANLPENTVYVKHFNHAVAGWSKQIAYGMQTNKVFVRTLSNSVWTDWGPAVEIVDALTSSDPAKALSARQGKILLEMLQANNATIVRYTFNMSAGQSTVTGTSLEGLSLSYVPGVPFMVEKDGFPIWLGQDYTASNGTSITLTQAAALPSQIAITVFGAFSAADHYTKAQADARYYQKVETFSAAEVNSKLDALLARLAEPLMTVHWVMNRNLIAAGTLPLDGGLYSRATYPDAWALVRDGVVPKVTEAVWSSDPLSRASFTEGDGSTTFRVPDYNGKSAGANGALFTRGDGANAAAAGLIQLDALQAHQHTVNIASASGSSTQFGFSNYGTGTGGQYGTNGALLSGRSAPETRPINVSGVWTVRLQKQ